MEIGERALIALVAEQQQQGRYQSDHRKWVKSNKYQYSTNLFIYYSPISTLSPERAVVHPSPNSAIELRDLWAHLATQICGLSWLLYEIRKNTVTIGPWHEKDPKKVSILEFYY